MAHAEKAMDGGYEAPCLSFSHAAERMTPKLRTSSKRWQTSAHRPQPAVPPPSPSPAPGAPSAPSAAPSVAPSARSSRPPSGTPGALPAGPRSTPAWPPPPLAFGGGLWASWGAERKARNCKREGRRKGERRATAPIWSPGSQSPYAKARPDLAGLCSKLLGSISELYGFEALLKQTPKRQLNWSQRSLLGTQERPRLQHRA